VSFWRKDNPVFSEPNAYGIRNVLTGGMFDHQRDWWDLPNFIRLLVGGYGSGKTISLGKWIIATALHNAPAWSAIVSPSFPQARRTVIPKIEELLEGKCSIRSDMRFQHNKGDHSFTIEMECRPKATLLYLSGDNPDSLKGPNLGAVAIDEPFIQDRAVFDQMVARTRDPRAKLHAIGLGGTPEQLNWGYEICEGGDKGKYDIGMVDTRSNLALPPAYAKRLLASYDQKTADAYIAGKFVNLSAGRVFYAFDKDKNVTKADGNGATHFAGMDFNVNPMAFCVGWHRGERIHISTEYEEPNSDTESACSIIRSNHPDVRLCFPDPTGKRRQTNAPAGMSDFKWIARSGMVVMAPTEAWGRRDSFNSVNKKFSNGSLTIDPSCKRLIRYLSEHTHENMTKQEHMTHLLDAMRYPVTYLFPAFRMTSRVSDMVA
jgi:hypothetical protein